jgi:ribonuclease HI
MIEVYTDGGSRGNPGKSACAFVVYKDKVEIVAKNTFLGIRTNNQAEYEGLIKGLEYIRENNYTKVRFFSDSELMVKQLKKLYRVKDEGIKLLFDKAEKLISQLESFEIIHVRRESNKRADLLVNKCLDEEK